MASQAEPAKSANFFRNYNRLVGFTYVAIVLSTLGLFLFQIQQKHKEEVKVIQGHVDRHAQFVEFILRSSLDNLEALRLSADNFYDTAPSAFSQSERHIAHTPLFKSLQQQDAQSFNLNQAKEKDTTGNLIGLGKLSGRKPEFYLDVEMALNLNQLFQAVAFNLPNASASRFISVENFSHTYPWMEAAKRPHAEQAYLSAAWLMGTPEKNPTREKYWAPVYYGGPEVGLLVPTSAPIYNKGRFRGVVSIDTSIDYLNRINSDFAYKPGTAFLVDAYGQVVAHPDVYANALEVQSTQALDKVMPAGVLAPGRGLSDIPPNQPTQAGDYLVVRHPFISAPWQLVFIVPKDQLWKNLLLERGPLMLLVIVGLTLLMVVTYSVTSKEFISPASKLVAHIAAESQFTPAPIPAVPTTWKPWFETISEAFRQSLKLASVQRELNIAADMQLSMLPRQWPAQREFSLWGLMRSAKEVGGDFYDHFPLPGGRIGIVVADVSGKGVPAALFGMVSKTVIRANATGASSEAGDTIAVANDFLSEDNDGSSFVTTFYAVFDPATGSFTYVNGGHPPPLLVHLDGTTQFLAMTDGIALGIADGVVFAQQTIQLRPGDYVIMYSDGVTEAFNPQQEEFTEQRLPPLFENRPVSDVNAAVERVLAAVDAHADGAPQSDDITCVVLQFHAAAAIPVDTASDTPAATQAAAQAA